MDSTNRDNGKMSSFEKLLFKKVELWMFGTAILLSVVVVVLFGSAVRNATLGEGLFGPNGPFTTVGEVALKIADIPNNIGLLLESRDNPSVVVPQVTRDQKRFGDLSGWIPTQIGSKSENLGLLLLSRYDGDHNRWIVELIDLDQKRVLHLWASSSDSLYYGKESDLDPVDLHQRFFQHPLLNVDGSLVSFDQNGVVKTVDACGKLLWHTETVFPRMFHHSIERNEEGQLWIPSKIYPQALPGVGEDFEDDAITKLSPEGKILLKRSVSQILIDNGYNYLIYGMGTYDKDPVHLNDIQPVNYDGPFWKEGDVFLSLRNQSMIMLYRPATNKIIWSQQGPWIHQHDVDILNDHQLLVFDNRAYTDVRGLNKVIGHNQVMIYDFETNETTVPYKLALELNGVRTIGGGRSEIYPNGDLFVEETEMGRVLRVTRDGQVVWQYVNRGDDGRIYHLMWSRIIHADRQDELTNFINDLKCEY